MPDASEDAITFETLALCPCCPGVTCESLGGRTVSAITPGAKCCREIFLFSTGDYVWIDVSKVAEELQSFLTPGMTLQELSEAAFFIGFSGYSTQADCIAESGGSTFVAMLPQMGCLPDPGGGPEVRWQISFLGFDTPYSDTFITDILSSADNPLEFKNASCPSFFITLA